MRVYDCRFLSVLISLLLCAGCASSPSARYFSLEAMPVSGGNADGRRLVGIGPVGMARYLKRPQMVTRGANNEMLLDEFSRWAEPLDDVLPRVLTSDLAALLPQISFVQLPTDQQLATGISCADRDQAL